MYSRKLHIPMVLVRMGTSQTVLKRSDRIDHTNNDLNLLAVSLQTILSDWLGSVWWSLASLRMLLAWLEATNG